MALRKTRHLAPTAKSTTLAAPNPMRCSALFVAVLVLAIVAMRALAIDDYERSPIEYSRSGPGNCVCKLQARLANGELQLEYDGDVGYLKALLRALDVPIESQMLVFSKTSLQRHRISPSTPRAIYFNAHVYVGYCRSGDVIEISAVDPQLGAVFYTLDQKTTGQARLTRQTENCLICHSSSRTESVPGHVVRSLFADSSGQPILSAGSYSVDHTTPLEHRWGGWYVTGTHGAQTHLGNLIAQEGNIVEPVRNAQGQNVLQLDGRLQIEKYLTPHSDIVALMVLEHQTLVQNRLTRANFSARQALHYENEVNRALGEAAGHRMESTTHRIESAGDDLVKALLLVGEAKLTAPVSGTSGYAEQFSRIGPRDRQGRSLRELDLQRRLFKYPCSYLIYSEGFDALPEEMRQYVWRRLWEVLTCTEEIEPFSRLSKSDRQAVLRILRETKPNLPNYWTMSADSS